MKNKKSWVFSLVLLVLLISVFFIFIGNSEDSHLLLGTYQSETDPPDIVMMSFFEDGSFEEYQNSELINTGTFLKENEEVYLLFNNNETILVILQQGDQFYYYSSDERVYLLKNLDKTPTTILNNID